jgi:hypothetical protein
MEWNCQCGAANSTRFCTKCGVHAPFIFCKICDRGHLSRQRIYRLSGPAVFIGMLFLIPSVLGMIFCGLAIAVSLYAGSGSNVIAIGVLFGWGLLFFVSGLFGWLLTMKKDVLKCSTCGAVVSAS